MFDSLGSTIEIFDKYANIILVLSTAVYAFLTFEMVAIMKRQVVSNIKVSKVILKVGLCINKENFCNLPISKLIKKIGSKEKDAVFLFFASVDFINISSGSGTVDQPKLILKFKKKRFSYEVRPTGERIGGGRKTIFLSGGGFEKVDLEYFIAYNEKLFEYLKKEPQNLECYIIYGDNLGRKHLMKVVNGLK